MKKLTLPGSKSITNRDLILASLTEGRTILNGILVSEDTRFMINALRDMGVEIEDNGTRVVINGGVENLNPGEEEIYLGQSGTCMRFLPAFACLLKSGKITFSGEERLMERPMEALIDGIKQLGVDIKAKKDKFPPIIIDKNNMLTEGFNPLIKMDGTVSSQFFTALLNIGAFIEGGLEIEVIGDLVSKPYIDMTIFELEKFGIEVENNDYKSFIIPPFKGGLGGAKNLTIEGDASALSYIANYIVLHGGRIEIQNLGKNTKQGDYKYLEILEKYFGLLWESDGEKTILKCGGIDKLSTEGFNPLNGEGGEREINFENMPDISMSFMSLAIFLPGKTKITGLKTLNLKECKRIDAMRDELKKLGIEVESDEESIIIGEYKPFFLSLEKTRGIDLKNQERVPWGREMPERQSELLKWFSGKIKIETYNDHRIAMTFGVLESYLSKKFKEKIKIINPDCVAKTYPNFWEDLEELKNLKDSLRAEGFNPLL